MLVMIYDAAEGWDARNLPPGAALPGAPQLCAGALCPPGHGCLLWTDTRLLAAYQRLSEACRCAPPVRYGFRRPSAFLHAGQSAHCAGLALDLVLWEGERQRPALTRLALSSGFDWVEPPFLSPGWLHVECRIAPPAWPLNGFPPLRQGDRGVHVMALQDLLCAAGQYRAGLTGVFNRETAAALAAWQRKGGFTPTGRADAAVWAALAAGHPRRCTRTQYPPSRALM